MNVKINVYQYIKGLKGSIINNFLLKYEGLEELQRCNTML